MYKLDLDRYQNTKYLPARVISLRKNCNTRYMKLSVRAYWLKQWFNPETEDEEWYFEREKYFTFPVSTIGKKVFVEEERINRMRLLKETDAIRVVDKHTKENGMLDDDISCILE